jgi:dihydroorotase
MILIKNGNLIDPGRGMNQVADLVIDEGKITQLGRGIPIRPVQEVIDATGWAVCPGFIDLHCHLREPGFEEKETIATGTKAAAAGGFVAVCCMANTNPPIDNRAMVEWVKQKASGEGVVHVFPIGCVTRDRKGEELCDMAELAEAGVVAFSDDGAPVVSSQVMHRALEYSHALGLPVVDHCEDRRLSNDGVVNEGWVSAKLCVKGIPTSAEEMMVARDLALAKLANARIHIAHVSTCGSVELIRRAKEEGILVTAEVTPHHLTLTEERVIASPSPSLLHKEGAESSQLSAVSSYDTNAKVNPPLRTEDDITCLMEGLKNGVLDAIATDHAPHTLADKDCGLEMAAFGISGFETAFGALMGLVHKGEISLVTLISKLTCEPARIVGKDGELGMLKVGSPANITIFDPDREWVVNSSKFASKGKNTPFDGCKFKGKVMVTIVDGEVVYMDDSLKSHCQTPSVIASEAKQTGSLKIRRIFRVESHG